MFAYPRNDLVAGVVVFLVALPLCLGIAVASGVPPVSGLIAGIVGGLVVPWFSRSPLSITGPAAGLTSIVLAEVARVGMPAFFTAVAIAGALQIAFGALRAGGFSALVPGAVIKGMLAAIGATILLKQLPVAFGVVGKISDIPSQLHLGATIITVVSLIILFGWPKTPLQRIYWLPPALIVVALAVVLGLVFETIPALALGPKQFVSVPTGGIGELVAAVPRPDLTAVQHSGTWIAAITIALVASIETLLSVQAVDRLDPLHRKSPTNRELFAQGAANLTSGLLGGLPVTAVIVRSSANVAAGGRERLAAIVHALLLAISVVALGTVMNMIPLACLAAVLIKVGVGLLNPAMFRQQWALGVDQFVPFIVTIAAVLYEDLLIGVAIGIVVGVLFVLRQNARGTIRVSDDGGVQTVKFRRDGTFVAKPALQAALDNVPDNGRVVVDATGEYVDHDMKELIAGFLLDAKRRGIQMEVRGLELAGVGAGGH